MIALFAAAACLAMGAMVSVAHTDPNTHAGGAYRNHGHAHGRERRPGAPAFDARGFVAAVDQGARVTVAGHAVATHAEWVAATAHAPEFRIDAGAWSYMWNVHSAVARTEIAGATTLLMGAYLRAWQMRHIAPHIARGATILDIGAGTGRSLPIWRARAARVWALEPAPENIARLRHLHAPEVQSTLEAGGEADTVRAWMPAHTADVVTMIYSLTFFFHSQARLRALIRNICHALRPGGSLMVLAMDGEHAARFKPLSTECYTVRPLWGNAPGPYARELEITMHNPHSLVQAQREYLVSFSEFAVELRRAGFRLKKSQAVEPAWYLTGGARTFAAAQRLEIWCYQPKK